MTWQENKAADITTSQVFFFDPTKGNVINRICDELTVDLFPSLDFKTYYFRTDGAWRQIELQDSQKIQYDINVFNPSLVDKLQNAPSNILFVFERDAFKGLLHFTDFGKKIIYETLFKNFFEFEKNLKQYLSNKGLGYDKFIEYYSYKAAKEAAGSKNRQMLEEKINRISEYRKTSPNLDLFTLLELLLFTVSEFHKQKVIDFNKQTLLANNKNKGSVDGLRNMIMHTRDNTGTTETLPHDFDRFKELFFNSVLAFREAFSVLQSKLDSDNADKRKSENAKLLDYLHSLDGNQLRDKFFDYDKYI